MKKKPGFTLVEVDRGSAAERKAFVSFVNRNYPSPMPLEEVSFANPAIHFFWAVRKSDGKRLGATGYVARTPFLAETVKTVVDQKLRGQGLGTQLSQSIEDLLRARGFRKAVTTIYIDNLSMILIKLRQGYVFEGFHRDHDGPGLHEYSLGKPL
jgi:GNAT superfamily N-acetyltransferase